MPLVMPSVTLVTDLSRVTHKISHVINRNMVLKGYPIVDARECPIKLLMPLPTLLWKSFGLVNNVLLGS